MEWHIRLVLEGEDRLVRNLEARESETFSYAADVNPEYNNEMEDPRINVMDFVLNDEGYACCCNGNVYGSMLRSTCSRPDFF